MQKYFYLRMEMPGYHSGETDFAPAYQRACDTIAGFADSFEANILAPIIEVAQDTQLCGHLRIYGISDRVDTPGLDREQIRDQEFAASQARGRNASDGIFAIVNSRLGGILGVDWSSVPNIAEVSQGIGAAVLANGGSPLSEAQRQQNRRFAGQFVKFAP